MAEDFRVECPVCGTSYLASRMKLRVGPREKAISWCVTCQTGLEIYADHAVTVEQPARSWRNFWRKPAAITHTAVKVDVKVRG